MRQPSAEEQLEFLAQLQRLLDESSFVATYKFALLLALAQVSIECGDDSGASLRVTTRQLAEHFVRIYWRQAVPYAPVGRTVPGSVLKQNTGKQAAILRQVEAIRVRCDGSVAVLIRDGRAWKALLSKVAAIIERMPLWRLQLPGQTFLYERGDSAGEIVLQPGVAFCFRRFQPLLQELVHGAWTRFVRTIPDNRTLVGEAKELEEFLFGSERTSLAAFHPILREIQGGRCFYCLRTTGRSAVIDHFIPWSRYAIDLGHNLVLADGECNSRKRDRLVSVDHLARWCDRNMEQGAELSARFDEKGLLHDLGASLQITRWAYTQAQAAGAQVWTHDDDLVSLDPPWRSLPGLAATSP